MKTNTKTLATAALAGLFATSVTSVALGQGGSDKGNSLNSVLAGEKDKCSGKDGCKGKKKDGDKNKCSGKDGCKGKDKNVQAIL